MGELADSVEKALSTGLLPRGEIVLAACSGGADSVALAHALWRHGDVTVAIGHVDHGLRAESSRDAERVRALAGQIGCPVFVERLSGLPSAELGLEAAAREARYPALARLAQQAGAKAVATAHTRRDQAETLLLRLLRGAGPGTLAGVRRRRTLAPGILLVRPLLDVARSETEAYCRAHGLDWLDDPHNSDLARARAKLRALWPRLLELNPRLEESLSGAAALFADEDDLLESLAAADAAHPALQRRALLRLAREAGVRPERGHIETVRALIARGRGALDLPGGRAVVEGGLVRFEPVCTGCTPRTRHSVRSEHPAPAEVAVPGPGSYAWHSRELHVSSGLGKGLSVDLDRAPFPWTLRGHKPGDRFRPAGGRSKKVADLWIDAHIPRPARTSLGVLADAQGRVFWVEGLREGESARGHTGNPASFRLLPEISPAFEPLTSKRQPQPGSVSMDRRPDEEPR